MLVGEGQARAQGSAPAPCTPMAWLRGNLLPLARLPWWQRAVYRLFRLPPLILVEPEGEVRIADIEVVHYNRERGARLIRERNDRDGYLLGVPFETEQGEGPHKAGTFSRPCHPAYRRQEERDAALYTGDLRECIDMTLQAENVRLRQRLELYDRYILGIERDVKSCEELTRQLRT